MFGHQHSSLSTGNGFVQLRAASEQDARALAKAGLKLGSNQSIKLALVPSDVRSSEEIDNYMPGYRRFPFRADEVAPVVLVDASIGEFRVYDLANIFRPVRTETSLQAPVAEVDPETSIKTYRARPYALGGFIPAMTRAQAKNFDPEVIAARRIGDALGLAREQRVMTMATTLNNWATTARTTLTSDYRWNGGSLSDPLLDIQTRIEASTQPVTDVYLGVRAVHAMLRHPKMVDYIASALGGGPRPQAMIDAMGGPSTSTAQDFQIPGLGVTFHVVSSRVLNDTTGALDEIIGNHVFMTSNPPGDAQFEDIRTFQTFRVRGPSGTGFVSRTFEVPNRGRDGGDMLVSGYDDAEVIVTNSAGGLIRSVVQ
jgi:hypothetical protein